MEILVEIVFLDVKPVVMNQLVMYVLKDTIKLPLIPVYPVPLPA